MYYEITKNKINSISFENILPKNLCIAFIDLNEFKNIYKQLKIDEQIIGNCTINNTYSKSIFEIYEDYYFASINIHNIQDSTKNDSKIGIILKKNLIIIIEIIDNTNKLLRNKISKNLRHINCNNTPDQIISSIINILIDGFSEKLQYMENKIISIEKELLKREISPTLNILIFTIKKELSLHKQYLDNILDLIQNIKDIDQEIFELKSFKYINNLETKITRLNSITQYLIDNAIYLRDMYQSALDFYQNRVIKILTVITTIFLPLSLLAAWYGMNFKFMPELTSKYAYPIVIIISLLIIIICFIFFKKKKIL